MTRLTEALERAQANKGELPQPVETSEPVRDVPEEWQFSEPDTRFDSPASSPAAVPVQATAAAVPAPAQIVSDIRPAAMPAAADIPLMTAVQDAPATAASESRTEK